MFWSNLRLNCRFVTCIPVPPVENNIVVLFLKAKTMHSEIDRNVLIKIYLNDRHERTPRQKPLGLSIINYRIGFVMIARYLPTQDK